jgi:hypothetical protein
MNILHSANYLACLKVVLAWPRSHRYSCNWLPTHALIDGQGRWRALPQLVIREWEGDAFTFSLHVGLLRATHFSPSSSRTLCLSLGRGCGRGCIKFCAAVSARSNAFFSYLGSPPLSTFASVPPSRSLQHARSSLRPFPPSPNRIAGYDVHATVIKQNAYRFGVTRASSALLRAPPSKTFSSSLQLYRIGYSNRMAYGWLRLIHHLALSCCVRRVCGFGHNLRYFYDISVIHIKTTKS